MGGFRRVNEGNFGNFLVPGDVAVGINRAENRLPAPCKVDWHERIMACYTRPVKAVLAFFHRNGGLLCGKIHGPLHFLDFLLNGNADRDGFSGSPVPERSCKAFNFLRFRRENRFRGILGNSHFHLQFTCSEYNGAVAGLLNFILDNRHRDGGVTFSLHRVNDYPLVRRLCAPGNVGGYRKAGAAAICRERRLQRRNRKLRSGGIHRLFAELDNLYGL